MQTITTILHWISILFLICSFPQIVYMAAALIKTGRKKPQVLPATSQTNRYAVLIAARNEETCLPDLIWSIHAQDYPQENITVFVVADNCTDNTAAEAARYGARVYTRSSVVGKGKGYALSFLLKRIYRDFPDGFDGYFVFDADNILAPDFITEMDRKFSEGNEIVTGYRNSKNFGSSWISSSYALWFMRTSKFMNAPREFFHTSSQITGTGFLVSRRILEKNGGWIYHLLTEDFEFTVDQILLGNRIAFCETAEFFDEQPITFAASWNQRIRWAKGYLQVFGRYGKKMMQAVFTGNYAAYDVSMASLPSAVLSLASFLLNLVLLFWENLAGGFHLASLYGPLTVLLRSYLLLACIAALTVLTEREHIRATAAEKVRSVITFPIFMFSYIPITLCAIFARPEWKPIPHVVTAQMISVTGDPAQKVINF